MPMVVLSCSHLSIVALFDCVLGHTQGAEQVLRYQGHLPPAMQRSLQQAAGPAGAVNYEGVRYVKSPEKLQMAVTAGARHIQITEHLDLSTLEPSESISNSSSPTIIGISNNTLSVHVRSTSSCCAATKESGCAFLAFILPFAPLLWRETRKLIFGLPLSILNLVVHQCNANQHCITIDLQSSFRLYGQTAEFTIEWRKSAVV
jgi:hypothetical protein